jgi:hypothetical protein
MEERRTAPREPCDREVALRPLPAGDRPLNWASVRNISRGGLGLLLSNFFPPGTALALRLPGKRAGEYRLVPVRVVHAGTGPHGNAYLGCAFAGDPGPALEALRQKTPSAPPSPGPEPTWT